MPDQPEHSNPENSSPEKSSIQNSSIAQNPEVPPTSIPPRDTGESPRIPHSLPLICIADNVHPCSYLPEKTATMPLHVAQPSLSDADFEVVLEAGLRRSGQFTYYTACENCQACEPVRIDANKFHWSDSWRRIINRGDRLLRLDIGPPEFSIERLQLFNIHRDIRNLGHGNDSYTPYDYQSFLIDSCCDSTYELRYYLDNSLVALSVIDLSSNSISAVYTYFDPNHAKLSLGSYSVLKQIRLAQRSGRKWVYLGLYVAENQHLNYKARFLPQERYINRQWIEYSRPTEPK